MSAAISHSQPYQPRPLPQSPVKSNLRRRQEAVMAFRVAHPWIALAPFAVPFRLRISDIASSRLPMPMQCCVALASVRSTRSRRWIHDDGDFAGHCSAENITIDTSDRGFLTKSRKVIITHGMFK
jgi:hypothetical protein